MKYDFSVFQEPRGVMRVFQFVSKTQYKPKKNYYFLLLFGFYYNQSDLNAKRMFVRGPTSLLPVGRVLPVEILTNFNISCRYLP